MSFILQRKMQRQGCPGAHFSTKEEVNSLLHAPAILFEEVIVGII
jgi:hypothetical protein